jgi:hypothetical protein
MISVTSSCATGADPKCRTGQSTKNATHLIKVVVEAALGLHSKLAIYGSDYPTPDVPVFSLAIPECNVYVTRQRDRSVVE